MKKLKVILFFSVVLVLILTYIRINKFKYNYKEVNNVEGIVTDINYYDNKVSFIVKGKEKVLVNDYNSNTKINLGDKVYIEGKSKLPNVNTNFNLFNYRKYLMSKKIFYTFDLEEIQITKNDNLFYKIKNSLIYKLDSINNNYLYTLILADNKINDEIYLSYQTNGISHLFAVSGMHISLITGVLFLLLNKVIKNKKITSLFISSFLIFYIFLTGFSASVIRSSFMFIGISIFKIFNLKVDSIYIISVILIILLLVNPFYLYDIGFIYSFSISISLILLTNYINSYSNYFSKLFIISLISFLVSIPITVNQNFEINLLSPFVNMFFVPFVSFIFFPFAIISMIIPSLLPVFNILIFILEKSSIIFTLFKIELVIPHLNFIIIIMYYLLVYLFFKTKNKYYLVMIFVFLLLCSNYKYFDKIYKITMIDVGQGDSILIEFPHNKENIMIDTGGNYNYDLSKDVIIPFLKSKGIKKLSNLIITHGDFDHMGSSFNLINNFKVENVIFNKGTYNELENALIKVLEENNINYTSNLRELRLDNVIFYFLNTKVYDNENDNSSVIYVTLGNKDFLFMGDASVEVEKDLIEKYNLQNIDVLKVGHHGSKTSSSKDFINELNPKYSFISVGKNNFYGHPNKEVLGILENSELYRTDQDGSIMFKMKKNRLQIKTCIS